MPRELRAWLAVQPVPRPGVVLQANHRDAPSALPLAELQAVLDLEGLAVVESVAIESHGIRQAFVLAVGLALERARALQRKGELPQGPGETDDPGVLLARIQSLPSPLEGAEKAVRATAAKLQDSTGAPRLPDARTPGGRLWPPIEGRAVLESATVPGARPRRGPNGCWHFRRGLWYVHSARRHEIADLDDARLELVQWARGHAKDLSRLSPRRCLALADTGLGTWRLWQVLSLQESCRQTLYEALRSCAPEVAAQHLRTCAELLGGACGVFQRPPFLPCRLDVLGEAGGRPVYVGLLPPVRWEPPAGEYPTSTAALVRREIEPLVEAVRPQPPAVEAALAALLSGP